MKFKIITLSVAVGALILSGLYFYQDFSYPSRFRSSTTMVKPSRLVKSRERCYAFNRAELDELNFSASQYPALDHLGEINDSLGGNFLVVSGLHDKVPYIAGKSLNYFNYYVNDGVVVDRLEAARKYGKAVHYVIRRLLNGVPLSLDSLDESQIYASVDRMHEMGINYVEPLPANWLTQWDYVQDLIPLFQDARKRDTQLHFYCENGKGRTTTMSILYDIFANSKKVSLDDIVTRHFCLGGEDLSDTVLRVGGTWTDTSLKNRYHLVKAFYDYMNEAYPQQTWVSWLESKQGTGYSNLPIVGSSQSAHRSGDR